MIIKRSRPAWALTRTLSAAALGVGLTTGVTATALAFHRDSAVQKPLRGLITAVGSSTLQLQTANGTVSVPLVKGTTHVVRSVMGSTADVTTGKHVDLHLVKGTHTVDAIHIEQDKPAHYSPGDPHTAQERRSFRATPGRERCDTAADVRPGRFPSTVESSPCDSAPDRPVSFTLGPNVHVNETLTGSLADLGVGETVQIFLAKSGSVARSIIITNA